MNFSDAPARALIVDDEVNGGKNLELLLNKYCPAVEILAVVQNLNAARTMLQSSQVDIVFLDIQMDRESGFDLLPDLPLNQMKVIFVTAHEAYAIRAIKVGCLDYLLKPIDIEELQRAVSKALDAINGRGPAAFKSSGLAQDDKLVLHHDGKITIHKLGEVVRIEADAGYSNVHFKDRTSVLVSKPLKVFEDQLSPGFIRIHQSYLVNLEHVEQFSYRNSTVRLSDQVQLAVSKRKLTHVTEVLKNL